MAENFEKWRSFLWPIERAELKKFVPLFLVYFFITLCYNILRNLKDTILITAPNSGAEAIPFAKVWAVMPLAVCFTVFFAWLSNRVSREKVFYIMISIFLSFFLLFIIVLYPLRESLHPNAFANTLEVLLPKGFKGLIVLLRNWTFTLCYVMADLWSSVILAVLFWGFTNEITKVDEAKRFYGTLMVGSNFSGFVAGQLTAFFSTKIPYIPGFYGTCAWDQSVFFILSTVVLSGLLAIVLFRHLNRKVVRKELPFQIEEKPRLSFKEQLIYLFKSSYLGCIALIVLSYNLVINLIEVVWKNQLKQLHPDPAAYSAYMGQVLTVTSIIATITSLVVTSNVLRRYSWTVGALIPALTTLVTGVFFFFFSIFSNNTVLLGFTPLFLSVTFGSIQNCLTRASKYTLFDATTNLALIPLDNDIKLKGKAAIDGIGSRLGKSGGSIIYQGSFLLFTTVTASTPFIAIFFLLAIGVWIFSIKSLGKRFNRLATEAA